MISTANIAHNIKYQENITIPSNGKQRPIVVQGGGYGEVTGCVGSPFGNLLVTQNKKGYGINHNPFFFSVAEGDRTPDLLSAIQARS